ncbi:MAG: Oxidoreductase [Nocardia sp.]|nr:Oxidoreductase [Nocardia sp.]
MIERGTVAPFLTGPFGVTILMYPSSDRKQTDMDISGRTVLIVGGTSGIGLGLARLFVAAGSTVIVGGRNTGRVDDLETVETVEIDVADPDSIVRARDEVLARHPGLDVVVTMSGVMLVEDLRDPAHITQAETTIAINLLGTIRVIDAFTPHLIERGGGTIITVTSGIAFLPFPLMPTYAASKAGVHAYTESLRAQLAGTGVEVTELIPPAVATAGQEKVNPAALPLDGFLDEVIELLSVNPTSNEILVNGVLMHRWAERDGTYAELVERRSQSLGALPGR